MLFTGGASNDLVALNATTGEALWHAILNTSISNGPITYELDGRQYVVAAAGDTLWTFVMNTPVNEVSDTTAYRSDTRPRKHEA